MAYSEGGEGRMNLGCPLTNGTDAGRSISAEGAEALLLTIMAPLASANGCLYLFDFFG